MAASGKQATGTVEEASAEDERRVLEPGAAPFGNFPHYSRFHPPEQRLRLLPPELLRRLFPQSPEMRPILGLDVGCNSGVSAGGRDRRCGSRAVAFLRGRWGSGLDVTSHPSQLSPNELKGAALADPVLLLPDLQGPTANSLGNLGEESFSTTCRVPASPLCVRPLPTPLVRGLGEGTVFGLPAFASCPAWLATWLGKGGLPETHVWEHGLGTGLLGKMSQG